MANVKERLLSLAREYGSQWAKFNAPEDFWGWMADRLRTDLMTEAWDAGYQAGLEKALSHVDDAWSESRIKNERRSPSSPNPYRQEASDIVPDHD